MSQPSPHRYHVDPDDPRAPPADVWNSLSDAERRHILDELPSDFPVDEANPPEGDEHRLAKELATDALSSFFERTGRRIYVSAELPVYYPGERMFAPDVLAVTDVEVHPRKHWTVSHEGKGLDFVLEILVSGRRRKDLVDNLARYARLGIPEYFVLDLGKQMLRGWRLEGEGRKYLPMLPSGGVLPSRVLGLELGLEGGKLRFFYGLAPVPQARELIARLDQAVAEQTKKREEEGRQLQQALDEARALLKEEARLRAEAEERAAKEQERAAKEQERAAKEQERAAKEQERAEQEKEKRMGTEERLVEALAEIERLRRERDQRKEKE